MDQAITKLFNILCTMWVSKRFLCDVYLGEELVNVLDAVVQVGDLVKGQALQVLVVSVMGQSSAECKRKLIDNQLQRIVSNRLAEISEEHTYPSEYHGPHHEAKQDQGILDKQVPVLGDN